MNEIPLCRHNEARVTFWGAAQSVTGSMHILQVAGRRVLLDCGLVRDRHSHAITGFEDLPFEPSSIEAVILSHAHSDHCGYLPRLIRRGFAGPIYCTPATRDLTALMLSHSARFQESETLVHHVLGGANDFVAGAHSNREAVEQTIRQCVPLPYHEEMTLPGDLRLRFLNAGHILGSAMVVLTIPQSGRWVTLAFTGDLGRRQPLLLRPPDPLPPADLLICESTYGGRVLEPVGRAVDALVDMVRRTFDRGGKVLIPAFSLGRMQVVVYALGQAIRDGRLPSVPVYVDSPLAAAIAEVHRQHADELDAIVQRQFADGPDPLGSPTIQYVASAAESNDLSNRREPSVWIAPGGMCEGGRILHHLKHHIDDPRCSVALVNYQAPHTPGRRLLERGPTVRFHGRVWNKWADIVYLPGFSGHADHDDLLACLGPLAGQVAKVRLVHGEVEAAERLANVLRGLGFADVAVPGRGKTSELG